MIDTKELSRNKWYSIHAHFIDKRFLTGKHTPCPLCGGKDRFRYDLKSDMGSYFCSGCGAGTGIHLLAMTQGITHEAAWRKVESVIGSAKEIKPMKPDYKKRIKEILASCREDDGQIYAYFKSRGLEPPQGAMLGNYWLNKERCDCIVLKAAKGTKLAGLHCTYIKDGKKLERKMYGVDEGSFNGSAIRLTLIGESDTLVIGEGVETTLSAMKMTGLPGWAAINAALLEQIELPPQIRTIEIFGDNDSSFTGQASAYSLAKRLKSKGLNVGVSIPAKTDTDWNDVLISDCV